jgi:hypothetical protein
VSIRQAVGETSSLKRSPRNSQRKPGSRRFYHGGTIDRLNKEKLAKGNPESDITFTTSHVVTGKVHPLVKDRHRSREFIEFLELLDAAYPAHTAIKLILDNHSAHISKETKAWLAGQPAPVRCAAWHADPR